MRILLLILCFTQPCHAFWGVAQYDVAATPPPSRTEYVGYPTDPDGEPEAYTNDQSYGVAGDRVYGRMWTATEDGTANAINIYQRTSWATADYVYLCLYNGTTLVGKSVDQTGKTATDTWTGYITITQESTDSLDFSTSDVLYFGYCADNGAIDPIAYDDGDSVSVIKFENDDSWTDSPPATVAWETSPIEGLMSILRYTD